MPNITVDATAQSSTEDAAFNWVQLWNSGLLYRLGYAIRGQGETEIFPDVEPVWSEGPQRAFWPAVTHAALNARSPYICPVGPTGDNMLDNVLILTANDVFDDMANMAVPTRNWESLKDLLRAYTIEILMAGMGEGEVGLGETGSEEQLLAAFRGAIAHSSSHVSERLQGFINRYEYCNPDLEPVPPRVLIEVKRLVSWLSQQDANMYATVTDDGVLALEATIASVGRLFVEVNRSGGVEATVVSADLGIRGLDVTTISELISVPIVSLIGGP